MKHNLGGLLPRQRIVTVFVAVSSFMVQGTVDGWIFPKQQTKLTLPLDYPLDLPFYKIVVVLDASEKLENVSIEFDILKIRTHIGNETDSRAIRTKPLVGIDEKSGTLYLIRKPTDLKIFGNATHNKLGHRILVNITIGGRTTILRKTEVLLEMAEFERTYCNPSPHSCFTDSHPSYTIPEGRDVVFDYLGNPSYTNICPNSTSTYKIISGNNYIHVDQQSGALTSDVDAEEINHLTFKVSCDAQNRTFLMEGEVNVMDVDDNAPTTQNDTTFKTEVRFLKPGEKWVKFELSVIDRDTKNVNDFSVKIKNDTHNLFKVRNIKIYELLNTGRSTYFYAEIVPQKALSFPGEYYNFSVVIKDKTFIHENGTVTFRISVVNRTETELPFKDVYNLNISRNATYFARLMQFTRNNMTKRFHFSIGTKQLDWLGITEHTGIVYVRDPTHMPSGVERRRVVWSTKNETFKKTGSVLLIITINESPTSFCGDRMGCSFHSNKDSCIRACGNGSRTGSCSWRSGLLIYSGLTPDYSTCSPDLSLCPDGHCDELESFEPFLCPQDCARQITGEATTHTNGQGIFLAVGTCTCPASDRCKCILNYPPPGEMRLSNMLRKDRLTTTPISSDNVSFVADVDVFIEVTTTPWAPLTRTFVGEKCGDACILILSMVPFGLLMFILSLLLARKLKTKKLSKHKFVGSHISLSAVPSDYVEETSVPDSRNTCSETVDLKWEFPRNRLRLLSVLGEGEFGRVLKAEAWNIAGSKGYTTVAVKMLKENGGTAEKQDLLTEFLLLKEISHPNVIKLLGASTEKNGEFYLIVEYAEMGSLRSYLRRKRRHQSYSGEPLRDEHSYFHKEQLSFAWQIAKGMAYLSDLKLVHRDLAARNVLLAKQKVIKISDFGLSRDVYEGETYLKRSKGKVPIKWMAIESLEDQIYTSRSDVWSFGVVLWEIMMNGATPYPGVVPQRLYNLLKAGYRMSKPDYCSDEVYLLMRQCWSNLPRERPSFKEIVLKLDFLLQDTVEYMNFVPKSKTRTPKKILPSLNETNGEKSSVQYTTVLLEDEDDEECYENIGLVNLFEQ